MEALLFNIKFLLKIAIAALSAQMGGGDANNANDNKTSIVIESNEIETTEETYVQNTILLDSLQSIESVSLRNSIRIEQV